MENKVIKFINKHYYLNRIVFYFLSLLSFLMVCFGKLLFLPDFFLKSVQAVFGAFILFLIGGFFITLLIMIFF